MATTTKDTFGDERLKKDSGADIRGPRDAADSERVQDGNSLSDAERRRLLRNDWVQEVLPTPPKVPGWHHCWLSTTNSTDPIYKRVQRGYIPVKASEIPSFGSQFKVTDGEFEGCVACNEMLLFKITEQLYNDLMTIYHHDLPTEAETSIREKIDAQGMMDSNGRNLGQVEGNFDTLGRGNNRPPQFR